MRDAAAPLLATVTAGAFAFALALGVTRDARGEDGEDGDAGPVADGDADASGVVADADADADAPETYPALEAPATPPRPGHATTVISDPPPPAPGGASTRVSRDDLDERAPRSAPDALRWEPGVYVQQTSSGQGSPFLRGRTGQQTLLLFDGIRLNHSLFRQGPNQYFFTVDLRSLESIDVIRGGASTRWGSDAIGGVLDAHPIDPAPGERGVRAGLALRGTSADDERGGRAFVHWRALPRLELVAGVGFRRVGLLESGGAVISRETGMPAEVPQLAGDGRTQLGTGFDELASDARAVWTPAAGGRLTVAVYDFRQLDAPRTDQCPPPLAPASECLRIDEQFRTLAYAAWSGRLGDAARRARFTLSWQRQHERHTRDRPSSFVQNGGRDDVITFGASAQLLARPRALAPLVVRAGGDLYHDVVDSRAWTLFTDVDFVGIDSRGQYLAGSRYTTGGAFVDGEYGFAHGLTLRGGVRAGLAAAFAPADAASATRGVDAAWGSFVGHLGAEWELGAGVALLLNADRSYRAPNLDDLTARQSVGPGYQFENAELEPETGTSAELGVRWRRGLVDAEGWLYHSSLAGAIARVPRGVDGCPPADDACRASASRFQLVNLAGGSTILGGELAVRLTFGAGLEARATVSAARGEDPDGQPLSRIPPVNGNLELRRRWPGRGFLLAGGLRWARAQDRLALSDRSDPRIPQGGTPGFVVVDLRASWRLERRARVGVVFENMADAAYRYHGSSVNGAGRGILATLELEY